MYNKVILVGNLTRDVELKYTPTGTAIAKFGLATNRIYKDSVTGENKQETMFIDITVFGRSAEIANQYLRKGSKVLVEGRLRLDSWEDPSGGKRSKHSVVVENMQMMGSRNTQEASYNPTQPTQNSYQQPTQTQQSYNQPQQESVQTQKVSIPEIDIDDEIPF